MRHKFLLSIEKIFPVGQGDILFGTRNFPNDKAITDVPIMTEWLFAPKESQFGIVFVREAFDVIPAASFRSECSTTYQDRFRLFRRRYLTGEKISIGVAGVE